MHANDIDFRLLNRLYRAQGRVRQPVGGPTVLDRADWHRCRRDVPFPDWPVLEEHCGQAPGHVRLATVVLRCVWPNPVVI